MLPERGRAPRRLPALFPIAEKRRPVPWRKGTSPQRGRAWPPQTQSPERWDDPVAADHWRYHRKIRVSVELCLEAELLLLLLPLLLLLSNSRGGVGGGGRQ